MVEQADTPHLKRGARGRKGSIPFVGTIEPPAFRKDSRGEGASHSLGIVSEGSTFEPCHHGEMADTHA